MRRQGLAILLAGAALALTAITAAPAGAEDKSLRFATFKASLNRDATGQLVDEPWRFRLAGTSPQGYEAPAPTAETVALAPTCNAKRSPELRALRELIDRVDGDAD
jgi:hypothetical protein